MDELIGRGRKILVTGAGGFIARFTIPLLRQQGYHVRALSRHPVDSGMAYSEGIEWVLGDVRDPAALSQAVHGVDAVVHLAVRKADEIDSFAVNVEGARELVSACREAGVERLVNVSTQAATYRRQDRYGRSKAAADRLLSQSGLPVTTLIFSLVYGDDPTGVFGKLADFVERLPVVPIIGPGSAVFQPIHVEDAAQIIAACLDRSRAVGPLYHVGGAEAITFEELVDLMMELSGRHARKVHLPWTPSLWAARLIRLLPLPPPVTVSNVLGLSPRNTEVFDLAPIERDLGLVPRGVRQGLAELMAGRKKGSVEWASTP